jgi:hypothetical protein
MAARHNAADHPSVRRHSVVSSAGVIGTSSASNNAEASSGVNARSRARISVIQPSRRSRPSPIGGSARVTSTNRSAGGG